MAYKPEIPPTQLITEKIFSQFSLRPTNSNNELLIIHIAMKKNIPVDRLIVPHQLRKGLTPINAESRAIANQTQANQKVGSCHHRQYNLIDLLNNSPSIKPATRNINIKYLPKLNGWYT